MFKHFSPHLKRSLLLTSIIFSILIVISIFEFINMGNHLKIKENIQEVDAIVVLSGGGTERIKRGVELYLQKKAPLLVVSGSAKDGSISNAESMMIYAVKHGVKKHDVLMDHFSKNTFENSQNSLILFDETPKSIILVTSDYHQKRALKTFKYTFPQITTIYNAPAESYFWIPEKWWANTKSFHLTLTETLKIWWGTLTGNWG